MNHESWELVKNNKNFNVSVYRKGLVALIASLGLSCILGLLLFYIYIIEREPDYYATNGVAPPSALKALTAPNMSSKALLDPDPPTELDTKMIPQ